MLSKRDKLIVQIAKHLGLFEESWLAEINKSKLSEPNRPLDKVLRSLGLITQKQQRQIARTFNEHVQTLRSNSGRLKKSKNTASEPNKTSAPNTDAPEMTIVLGASDQVSSSQLEKTTVLNDGSKVNLAKAHMDADLGLNENTVVIGANNATPAQDIDSTFVMRDAPAVEGTIVLRDDDRVAGPAGALDESTYVLRDETAPQSASPELNMVAPSSQHADLNIVKPSKGRSKPQAVPKQNIDSTFVMRDEDEPLPVPMDIESTFVMRDDDLVSPSSSPVPDIESTFVMRDTDLVSPTPDIDSTFVLRDEPEQAELNIVAPSKRSAAPKRRPAQPELNLVAPENSKANFTRDAEATFVLSDDDELPALSPLEDDLEIPDLDMPDDLSMPTMVLSDAKTNPVQDIDSTFVLRDETSPDLDLNLVVPDGNIDLGLDENTYVLSDNETDTKPKLDLGDLNLVSPSASSAPAPTMSLKSESRSSFSSPGQLAKKGGVLNREVFRFLAKNRKSFKGYTIGDYKVKGEISRGAMGVILKAEPIGLAKTMASARGFEGDVAVKVMLEGSADPKESERFLEEMKVLTKLNHTNIVRIFDCGHQSGLSYFSMELLRGVDVRDLVREDGPPPIMLTLKIISEVASALAFIHKSTVYHRDLKPMNIIFDKSTKPFRAVLIDFGLVTNHGSDGDKGLIVGTPQYMPPEQAAPRGGFGQINATSDIYSLGATLYYMLVGRPPFIGRDPRKIIKKVVSDPVKDPCAINPDVPKRIAEICLKCLEKQQRDRYTSAKQLLVDIEKELKASQRMLKAKSFISRFWNPKG